MPSLIIVRIVHFLVSRFEMRLIRFAPSLFRVFGVFSGLNFKWLRLVLLSGIFFAGRSFAQELPEPSRQTPLIEKKWDQLSNQQVGDYGTVALAIKPEKWKHAETDNFIIHFRRVTEAHPAVREVEYNLWFVAKILGATRAEIARKSHVFVFEDENEWQTFITKVNAPVWFHSFARGDELFLNIRQSNGILDSHTLAHETTHAVVSRIYQVRHQGRWPIWLNEGFAEHMGSLSTAAHAHLPLSMKERFLQNATISLDELTQTTQYPEDLMKVSVFYQSSEKLVRFLMTQSPKERFTKFIDAILSGKTLQVAVAEIYGDQYKDFDSFKKKYQVFTK